MNYIETLNLVKLLMSTGQSLEEALGNSAVPIDLRDRVRQTVKEEETIVLEPATMIVNDEQHVEWLNKADRSTWCYWPTLRQYLLTVKHWPSPSVQSLDRETDKILARFENPNNVTLFDKRGLVLGFVQSGKTSNYTALIAKAADSGYRLIIVLSGTDNGLRLQTHRRLKSELVGGVTIGRGVSLPPIGKQWFEFTRDELDGDFQPGFVNSVALQGTQPVLLVIKKNGTVLRRLLRWLESTPDQVMRTIPVLMIDDEADLASPDTRGSRQLEGEALPSDYEDPSVINSLIRDLLNKFCRKVYVAYTATPFANILIPSDTYSPNFGQDLYPRNFIIDLPKPHRYFGAEDLFGRMDDISGESMEGIDVIRNISYEDMGLLQEFQIPPVMGNAILSFVLSGAARMQRNQSDFPATMLVHISLRIDDQLQIRAAVDKKFSELKDDWRYGRSKGIRDRLLKLWQDDFLPVIQQQHPEMVVDFNEIEPYIGQFFESIQIRTVNSATGEILDYQAEPNIKAIAIGGNKLSRGLTLEGLLISVFVRRSIQYDTLMQMGRWFGFREGYEDLTRIYTTPELAQWFSDLALVEHRLREDIQVYEQQQITPLEVGMRIISHPTMQVTSPLKRRFASRINISQSYSGQVEQTFMFPLNSPENLAYQADRNLILVKEFLPDLGKYVLGKKGPVWSKIPAQKIIEFLERFRIDENVRNISLPLICSYIKRQEANGELTNWTVAICGRETLDRNLGETDWGLAGIKIKQISRSRLRESESLGVITSPGDETIGLSAEEIEKIREFTKEGEAENKAARKVRSPSQGLILLYPISKNSKSMNEKGVMRRPIYVDPESPMAKDLIGMAISFPCSNQPQPVGAYITGSVPWRPVE